MSYSDFDHILGGGRLAATSFDQVASAPPRISRPTMPGCGLIPQRPRRSDVGSALTRGDPCTRPQAGRNSDDSIDELIKRNIQDVVQAAGEHDAGSSFGQQGAGQSSDARDAAATFKTKRVMRGQRTRACSASPCSQLSPHLRYCF